MSTLFRRQPAGIVKRKHERLPGSKQGGWVYRFAALIDETDISHHGWSAFGGLTMAGMTSDWKDDILADHVSQLA